MFWQATFFSAANSAMAFYAISLGRPGAAAVCIIVSALGTAVAAVMSKQTAKAY
jgi:hypothetical protein